MRLKLLGVASIVSLVVLAVLALVVAPEDAVQGDARRTGADTSLAQRDLGYAPEVSLEEGISRQFAHQSGRHPADGG